MSLFDSIHSGIYLTEQEIILVEVKSGKMPSLENVIREPLPEGAVVRGTIVDEAIVTEKLENLRAKIDSDDCVVGLPVYKSYSALQDFPLTMNDQDVMAAAIQKASSVIPLPLSSLEYQISITREAKPGKATAFISGIDRAVFDTFKKTFLAAGFTRCQYVLENLALIRAIPVKTRENPLLMFVHNFDHSFLLSSVFGGHVFDGNLSHNLAHDFKNSYESYQQQTGLAPEIIIVSGKIESLEEIDSSGFKESGPKFISAEFKVKMGGETSENCELIVPIGLALSYSSFGKKGSFELLNLI